MAGYGVQQPKQRFSVAIKTDTYQRLINDTLGDKEVSRKFVAEITTVVSNNKMLQSCDAATILSAGLLAQSLNLPLAPALGFCYIVPYKENAQFQIGYKGIVQLAQRSGQFKHLGVREVHEGEYVGQDKFGDDIFKFSHDYDNNKTVGYFAYFELLNGFEKTMYMTKGQVDSHAKKYSKSYTSTSSTNLWRDNFDWMACKTVLKLLLNRWAPLSVEMQKAFQADQAIIQQDGTYSYVDSSDFDNGEKPTPKSTVRKGVSNSLANEINEEKETPQAPEYYDDPIGDTPDEVYDGKLPFDE